MTAYPSKLNSEYPLQIKRSLTLPTVYYIRKLLHQNSALALFSISLLNKDIFLQV
jgi:hypothetical protein